MLKLLRIELKKNLSYPTFWIFTGIVAGLFILTSLLIAVFEIDFTIGGMGGSSKFDFKVLFNFPHVWNTLAWIASWFNIMLTLLIIILVTNEYAYRTFRQHIIDGLKRSELLVSKIYFILVMALAFTVLVFIASWVFGLIYSKDASMTMIFKNIHFITVYFIQTIAYMTFGMMIAMLFKNTALSLIVYFGYLIFEGIFSFLLQLADIGFYRFLPRKIISGLTPRPRLDVLLGEQFSQMDSPNLDLTLSANIVICLIYITLFLMVSYRIFQKRDF